MSARMPGFPPIVAEKIACYLASGCSGTVEIQVHEGRIRGVKLVQSFRVEDDQPRRVPAVLDRTDLLSQDAQR